MLFNLTRSGKFGRTCVLPLLMAVAACATSPLASHLGMKTLQTSRQFMLQQLDRAWSSPQGSLIAIQRDLGADSEQVIGLQNATTINGDNFLWLRARAPDGRKAGQFNLNEFLSRTEGIPVPFSDVSDRNLQRGSDSLGPYFYLEWRSGGSTNCVLGFRRINRGSRILPRGTNALEAMLRNCVIGSVEDALLPILDQQISLAPVAGRQPSDTNDRMMSPLAAPPIE